MERFLTCKYWDFIQSSKWWWININVFASSFTFDFTFSIKISTKPWPWKCNSTSRHQERYLGEPHPTKFLLVGVEIWPILTFYIQGLKPIIFIDVRLRFGWCFVVYGGGKIGHPFPTLGLTKVQRVQRHKAWSITASILGFLWPIWVIHATQAILFLF